MLCTPDLTSNPKAVLGQIAELCLVKFGEGAITLVLTHQIKGGIR